MGDITKLDEYKVRFDEYKLFVEDLSRLQISRATRISSYVTINSFILGAAALLLRERDIAPQSMLVVIIPLCLAGFIVSLQWSFVEQNNRDLIGLRVYKLKEIEQESSNFGSTSMMYHAEEALLYGREFEGRPHKTRGFNLERWVPRAFLLLYASVLVAAIFSSVLFSGAS